MSTRQIRSMIERAIEDENRAGRLANTVRTVARNSGVYPTNQQIQEVVNFVKDYAQHVPYYLEQGIASARQVGLANEMKQMASEVEAYWLIEADLVPDHLGLLGIMDDAYVSLLLLQSLSDYCKTMIGRPLLNQDLTQANRLIRHLIGEPTTSVLDQRVGVTLAQAMMNEVALQFVTGGLVVGGGPDPYWGDASLDEIANVRLGALGIV